MHVSNDYAPTRDQSIRETVMVRGTACSAAMSASSALLEIARNRQNDNVGPRSQRTRFTRLGPRLQSPGVWRSGDSSNNIKLTTILLLFHLSPPSTTTSTTTCPTRSRTLTSLSVASRPAALSSSSSTTLFPRWVRAEHAAEARTWGRAGCGQIGGAWASLQLCQNGGQLERARHSLGTG